MTSRRAAFAALAVALAMLTGTAPGAQPQPLLQVEHVIELPQTPTAVGPPRELSALAWDEASGELWAVSDRGRLFRWRLREADGTLRVELRGASRIDTARDLEALAARRADDGSTEVWAAGERAAHAIRLSAGGQVTDRAALPEGLRGGDGPGRAGAGAGLEALAWQPSLGWLAALQKPRVWAAGSARDWHAVFAAGGRRWLFAPGGEGSRIKAIEPLPGPALLVLERVELPATAAGERRWRMLLRRLPLAGCGDALRCDAATVPVQPAPGGTGLGDHLNFEGLACAADGRCWLVSDSGPSSAGRTWLVQLRWRAGP